MTVQERRIEPIEEKLVPAEGMGATQYMWSDRRAYTISRVHPSGRRFWMREDIATRTDSNEVSESQTYSYAPNPEAPEVEVSRRSNGQWHIVERQHGYTGEDGQVVRGKTFKGGRVCIGYRHSYHDYSF